MTSTLRSLFFFVTILPVLSAQVTLEYATGTATYTQVLPLPGGGSLLVGTTTGSPHIAITSLGDAGIRLPYPLGGHGADTPHAAALDPNGNLWIAGNTDSDDFPLVNPVVAQKVPYRMAGFVMEIDIKGGKLLFSTYLGGQLRTGPGVQLYASHATAITIDAVGNVYVGGDTDEPDFPTTPGAFLSGKGGADTFYNTYYYSYVVKFSAAGKLVYSTLVGTGSSNCMGGSRCIPNYSTSAHVSSLAVDTAGTVAVAGNNGGAWNPGGGYVSRLAADGSRFLWTFTLPTTGITSLFMAQDSSGAMDLFGQYVTVVRFDTGIGPILGTHGLFAAKLRADGSDLVFMADLGQSADSAAAGLVLDSAGNAWIAGTSSAPALAGVPAQGSDFVLQLDAAGAHAIKLFRLPRGVVSAPPAIDARGNLLLIEAQSALLTLPLNYNFDSPAITGFANAASFALNTGIYPGALLTIFGFDLPSSPEVSFNGTAAPVLYASATQINVQVPFGSSAGIPPSVSIQVGSSIKVEAHPIASVGLFTTDGVHAAALNQDGTVNSESNPAHPGSIVSLFGTGAAWPAQTPDNTPAASAVSLDQGVNGFAVVTGTGIPLNVLYFGTAPGIIEGVFQINVQLPQAAAGEAPLQVKSVWFGNSNTVRVYID